MPFYSLFSGMFVVLLTVFVGTTSSLECISCEWDAVDGVSASCVSAPYKENATECNKPNGNFNYICETKLTFTTDKEKHYLSKVSRKCELEHGKCNTYCDPQQSDLCYSCCSANKCNSIPLSSAFMPSHLAGNVTNMAEPLAMRSSFSLFSNLLTNVFLFVLLR